MPERAGWRVHPALGRRRTDDEGRISILAAGLLLVVVAVVLVTSAITDVAVQQRRLTGLSDAAAAAALEGFGVSGTPQAGHGRLEVSQAQASERAQEFLSSAPAAEKLQDVRLEEVLVAADGVTVTVRLSATVRPGLLAGVLPAEVGVAARGRARLTATW